MSLLACTATPTTTPIPTIAGIDPELNSAIAEARESLDSFVEAIATPQADRTFIAVKVRFYPTDESSQDIWVDEVTYSNGIFRGSMGDDIPSLKLELGEKITVDAKDIVDWMIVEDGKLIGGYTIRLSYERMSPEEKERFLKAIDYSIDD